MAMAMLFSIIFKCISASLVLLGIYQFFHSVAGGESEFISVIVKSVNTFVIALAIFELGTGVGKEFTVPDEGENIYLNIRRTITRFVGTVCIALVRHIVAYARSKQVNVVSIGIIAAHEVLKTWYAGLGFIEKDTLRFAHLPFDVTFMHYRV